MKAIMRQPEDDRIIELLKGRDMEMEEGVKLLYQNYYGFLKSYIVGNSGTEQDAEDNFQDVIIAFVNSVRAGKFRGESSIKNFLYALNRNLWLNELKKRERKSLREEIYGNQFSAAENRLLSEIEYRQTHEQLMEALLHLGGTCKKLLLLFYFENRSMNEIALSLNYENEKVAKSKKFKCLKKMESLIHGNPVLYQTLKNYLHE